MTNETRERLRRAEFRNRPMKYEPYKQPKAEHELAWIVVGLCFFAIISFAVL